MKKSVARLGMVVFILVVVDQLAKLLIYNYFYNLKVEILAGILFFRPIQNVDMSWFGSLGIPLFSNYFFTVFINIVIFFAAITFYWFICCGKRIRKKLLDVTFVFLMSGVICSTIDRVLWKGSIDFIRLEGFFTFDTKDCYITIFVVLFLCGYFKYQRLWENITFKDYVESCVRWLRK